MKKIIAVIVVIAMVLGAKVFLEYRYDKGMDQAIQMMSPFASMTYNDIYIDLKGSIVITGVKVSSDLMGFDENVKMEKIELMSSDKFGLLTGRLFKNDSYPDSLQIKYTNIDVPASVTASDGSKGCSSVSESIDLTELGINRIRGDALINADFRNRRNSRIVANLDFKNIGYTSFDISVDATKFDPDKVRRSILPIKKLEVTNRNDEVYGASFISYCAKELNMTPEQYLSDVVSSPSFTKAFGLVLGPDLNDALIQSMKGEQELTLSIEPSKPETNFTQVKFYNTEGITKILNLQASLDGVPIDDMSFQKYSLADKEALNNLVKLNAIANGEDPDEEIEVPGFKEVKFNELNDHIGAEVQIERVGIKSIKGTLRSYKGGVVKIDQYRYGGQVTFPISRKEIAKIEVYY